MKPAAPKESARHQAMVTATYGRDLAESIKSAIIAEQPDDAETLAIYAHRVKACSSIENLWHATDLHNDHGEAFEGSGRFWHCGHKLCNYCAAKQSRRHRSMLRQVIPKVPIQIGYKLEMMTLTIVNEGIPLLEARKILYYAWTIFRKRKWFRKHIRGGSKSEEFELTAAGYHYHCHCIVERGSINFNEFREEWTKCVQNAYAAAKRVVPINTKDGWLQANFKKLTSIESAILETAKYVTKSCNWSSVKPDDLLDFCRIPRFPRMFELFGSFAKVRKTIIETTENNRQLARFMLLPKYVRDMPDIQDVLTNLDILDTRCVTDGSLTDDWRKTVNTYGAIKYLDRLNQQISSTVTVRTILLKKHYTAATFYRIKNPLASPYDEIITFLELLHRSRENGIRGMHLWTNAPDSAPSITTG